MIDSIVKVVACGADYILTYKLKESKSIDQAWADIEKTLGKIKPVFKGWKEATEWAGSRT